MARTDSLQERIIRALTAVKDGVTTLDRLAEMMQRTPDFLIPALARLQDSDRVAVWPIPGDPPRMGIALVSHPGGSERPARKGRVALASDLGDAQTLPEDARPSAAVRREVRESWEPWVAVLAAVAHAIGFNVEPVVPLGSPRPDLLLGCGIAWKGPAWAADEPCPGCKRLPMGRSAYCLCCDRYGSPLPTGAGPVKERPVRSARPVPDSQLRAGNGIGRARARGVNVGAA